MRHTRHVFYSAKVTGFRVHDPTLKKIKIPCFIKVSNKLYLMLSAKISKLLQLKLSFALKNTISMKKVQNQNRTIYKDFNGIHML
jgi:hypothetical protein